MGLANLYFRKVSVISFLEFPCRFRFCRKPLPRFLFRFHLKYPFSIPFPQNIISISFFGSLFPFTSETDGKFPCHFQTYSRMQDQKRGDLSY
jgi:hypothetical protein